MLNRKRVFGKYAAEKGPGVRAKIRLSILGIATGTEKRSALQSPGAEVFETTDRVLMEAFRTTDGTWNSRTAMMMFHGKIASIIV
jgi:hypothetical protein